jgi:hypothetical protein
MGGRTCARVGMTVRHHTLTNPGAPITSALPAHKHTGLLGSPPCPEVADVEYPWRRRRGGAEDLPELPAPRREVAGGPAAIVPPPLAPPREAPAERDALEAERRARTQEFTDSMWQSLE